MKPGQRLVLVTPIIFSMERWNAPWTKLVRLRSEEFAQYVSNDRRFARTTIYPPFPRKNGPNPVEADVLVKTR
jgi:mannosyltransferase